MQPDDKGMTTLPKDAVCIVFHPDGTLETLIPEPEDENTLLPDHVAQGVALAMYWSENVDDIQQTVGSWLEDTMDKFLKEEGENAT